MAKIKDVAKLANVSPSTVSLVLNNKGYVSEATRAKVQAAVKELNYVPSEVARNLSLNRTNIIGVIIPDIAHPFFAALLHEIEIALYRYGYKTMICSTGEKENSELVFLDMLRRHTMDGLIVGAHALHLESYRDIDLPIVAFDRFINDSIPIVRADHNQGGTMAPKRYLTATLMWMPFPAPTWVPSPPSGKHPCAGAGCRRSCLSSPMTAHISPACLP